MKPSIATHILDTERGEPVSGFRVERYRRDELRSTQVTDQDGRIADLVQSCQGVGEVDHARP